MKAGKHRQGRKVLSSRQMVGALGGYVSHQTIIDWMRQDFPAVYNLMRGCEENPTGVGGLPDAPSASQRFAAQALEAVDQSAARFRGVSDPALRGEVIAGMRGALKGMETAGGWHEPEPPNLDF